GKQDTNAVMRSLTERERTYLPPYVEPLGVIEFVGIEIRGLRGRKNEHIPVIANAGHFAVRCGETRKEEEAGAVDAQAFVECAFDQFGILLDRVERLVIAGQQVK